MWRPLVQGAALIVATACLIKGWQVAFEVRRERAKWIANGQRYTINAWVWRLWWVFFVVQAAMSGFVVWFWWWLWVTYPEVWLPEQW